MAIGKQRLPSSSRRHAPFSEGPPKKAVGQDSIPSPPCSVAYHSTVIAGETAEPGAQMPEQVLPEPAASESAAAEVPSLPVSSCRSAASSRPLRSCFFFFFVWSPFSPAEPTASGGRPLRPHPEPAEPARPAAVAPSPWAALAALARSLKRVFFFAGSGGFERIIRLIRSVRRLCPCSCIFGLACRRAGQASLSEPCQSESFPSCPASQSLLGLLLPSCCSSRGAGATLGLLVRGKHGRLRLLPEGVRGLAEARPLYLLLLLRRRRRVGGVGDREESAYSGWLRCPHSPCLMSIEASSRILVR